MASKLKIGVEAEVAKARAELGKINTSIETIKTSQEKTNNTLENFMKGGKFLLAAKIATDAIKKIVQVSKELIDIYKVQEQSELKLRNAITASGREADISADSMIKLASQYQSMTTYGDEAIISAQSMMLSYQNIGQDVFPRVMMATMDLSSALGKDLNDSVKKVGQALDDPVKNFASLKEAGINLSEQKISLIKTLVAENKQWQAQDVILKEIESRYGGLSQSLANTTTGKMTQLSNTIGDIKEEFGKQILDNIDGWVDIGQRLAEGFLTGLKVQDAEKTVANATPENVRPLQNYDNATLEAIVKEADKKIKSFESAYGQITRVNQVSKDEINAITAALNELAAREGDALQSYWTDRQKKLKELAIQTRNSTPDSPEEERRAINVSGTNPTSLQTTKTATGEVVSTAKKAMETVQDFFNRVAETYGGDFFEANKLVENNNAIIKDMETITHLLNGTKGKDMPLEQTGQVGFAEGVLNDEYGEYALTVFRDLQKKLEENERTIASLTGKTNEWLEIGSYIEANQVRINYSVEEQVGILENEILLNKQLLSDKDIKYRLSQEEITNLTLITEERERQLGLLKEEANGLKAAKEYLSSNATLLQDIPEYKIKAIEEQITLNKEMLGAVDLSEEQKKQLKDILDLLEKQKKAVEQTVSDNTELGKFLSDNAGFIKQSSQERIYELSRIKASAKEQLKLTNLTYEQEQNLKGIVAGIDEEIRGLREVDTWADKIQNAFDKTKPPQWDELFDNIQSGVEKVQDLMSGLTSSFSALMATNLASMSNRIAQEISVIDANIKSLTEIYNKSREALDESNQASLADLKSQYDSDAISYEEYMARKAQLDEEYKAKDAAIKAELVAAEAEKLAKQNELGKAQFEAEKKNNIASTIMNGSMAAIKTLGQMGWWGIPFAAIIAGMTTANVASIQGQQYIPALAEGGVATKPTLAMIGDGMEPEVVLPLSKAKDFGFGGNTSQGATTTVVNINGDVYGIDDLGVKVYEAVKSAQRLGKVPKNSL